MVLLGLTLRLMSVFFSRGYAFTDDHYFVIEEAQQWIYQSEQPRSFGNPHIILEDRLSHGALYTTIHYVLFQVYRLIGFEDPMWIMVSIRLFHALYSLLIITLGYRIARALSNHKVALEVAMILSIIWFMPFLSVRNLVEMVCIPPLMAAAYFIIINPENRRNLFAAGLFASLAFALRFQTILFSGMFGVVLIFQSKWRSAIMLLAGFAVGSGLLLGVLDALLFGTPFHELLSYIEYNTTHSGEYPNGPWYQYIGVVLGMLLIFSGGNWTFAAFSKFRTYSIIMLPVALFLLFHSYFPNKQERFILPVIPFLIIIGIVAWHDYLQQKQSSQLLKWNAFSKRFFWILNTPLLLGLTFASTRTAKMDAMYFLYQKKDAAHFAIESTHRDYMEFMPRFYGNYWKPYQHILPTCDAACFFDSIDAGVHPMPNYILFLDTDNIEKRIKNLEKEVPLIKVNQIESSWLDQLIPKLNPIVKSQVITIFKVVGARKIPPSNEQNLPAAPSTATIEAASTTKTTESP